ncbi:MAG TPA: hypothetical protein VGM51_04505 [Armatimonadota bacterium]|jgi:hypothetical protein
MSFKSAIMAIATVISISVAPTLARTPAHTVKHGTGPAGRWGVIVRKPTATNRNIRVRFANGENPVLEVPMKATITEDGRKVSIHDLSNGERVRVWTVRTKSHEAMQAWRIDGYTKRK